MTLSRSRLALLSGSGGLAAAAAHSALPVSSARVDALEARARYSFQCRCSGSNRSAWPPMLSDGDRNSTPPGLSA